MKYLIISDIHGSATYLNKVLEQVKDFDKLIILGDILYHGPRNDLPEGYNPKMVIEILNEIADKIIAIRGNCDAKVDSMVLNFNLIEHIWLQDEKQKYFLTHGDFYNREKLPSKLKRYCMLYGHFHINEFININEKIIAINLGSLSIPKDEHHAYGIIENGKYVAYDLLTKEKILEVSL